MRLGLFGALVMVAVAGGAGCGGGGLPGSGADAGADDDATVLPGCETAAECTDPLAPLCADDGVCVGCRDSSDCTDPAAPTCDDETRSCRACAADAECASGVCDPSEGTCVAASDIIYVDDDAGCGAGAGSAESPLCSIDEALAFHATTPRNWVRVRPGAYVWPALTQSALPWFVGDGAASVIGPAIAGDDCLLVTGAASLSLRGFRFAGCDSAVRLESTSTQALIVDVSVAESDIGVECRGQLCELRRVTLEAGVGVLCAGGARCVVEEATILGGAIGVRSLSAKLEMRGGRVAGASAVGLDLAGSEAEIVGVEVAGVGQPTPAVPSSVGIGCIDGACLVERAWVHGCRGAGVVIKNSHFDIRSSVIMDNGSDDGAVSFTGGVVLDADSSTRTFDGNTVAQNRAPAGQPAGVTCSSGVLVKSSVVWGNSGPPLGGSCSAMYSDLDAVVPGSDNIMADPLLTADGHLGDGSPCIDAGDPAGGTAVDIDGDARPRGARLDIGADEK